MENESNLQVSEDSTVTIDSVKTNEEFRIKWPRGELGALPDDAVQDLNIEYIQKELAKIQEEFDDHLDEPHPLKLLPGG